MLNLLHPVMDYPNVFPDIKLKLFDQSRIIEWCLQEEGPGGR